MTVLFSCNVCIGGSQSICIFLKKIMEVRHGLEVIELFSCSPQLSMKFFMLINVKMPTVVGILTFINRKNSIVGLSEPKKSQIS